MKRSIAFTSCTFLASIAAAWPVSAYPANAAGAQASSSSRTWRSPQRAPSRERYKQIQVALKERGYDPGPIDGQWGSKTSAALKRFERDHGLPADGKLDSLALITLGLGPQRVAGGRNTDSESTTTEEDK